METIKLRGHHCLCFLFFRGHGYSDVFTENMKAVGEKLKNGSLCVELLKNTDAVCSFCPHNENGLCGSHEKVYDYDRSVIELAELDVLDKKYESKIPWSEIEKSVREKILDKGLFDTVCGNCSWHKICTEILTNES